MQDSPAISDVFQLSHSIIQQTADFLQYCDGSTTSDEGAEAVAAKISAMADALRPLYVDLVNRDESDIDLALQFIFHNCMMRQMPSLWNAIYQKLFFHAQQLLTAQGITALYMIPVHVSVDAAHAGKAFAFSNEQRLNLINSLFSHQLVDPDVRVQIVSDLISDEDLPISIPFYQKLLRSWSFGTIQTPCEWTGQAQAQNIRIYHEDEAVDEIRYILLCLHHREQNFGDIDSIWSHDPESVIADEELMARVDAWSAYVEDHVLDEQLSALIWRPEPMHVAQQSGLNLLNSQMFEQSLAKYGEEHPLSCHIQLYGDPTRVGEDGVGIVLYLLDRQEGRLLEAIPYCRDKKKIFDADSMDDLIDILHSYDISIHETNKPATLWH